MNLPIMSVRFPFKPLALACAIACAGFAPLATAQTGPAAQKLTPSLAVPYSNWDERAVFAYIAAELLAQAGDTAQAADILWPQARQLAHPELLRSTVQWAAQGGKPALALEAAVAWEAAAPADARAAQAVDYLLVGAQRFAALTERASKRGKAVSPAQADQYVRLAALNPPANSGGNVYAALLAGLSPGANDGSAHWALAQVAAKAQLKTELETHVRAAALAQPPQAEAIFALMQNEPITATQAALTWTQRSPKAVDAWRTLGLIYAQRKLPQQSADAFARGLQWAPNDVLLHLERMDQLRAAKQSSAARASLMAAYAVRASITQPRSAQLLAEQLEEDYHPVKALELYDLATALAKDDAPALDSLRLRTLSLKARQGDAASLAALLALPAAAAKPEDAARLTFAAAAVLRDLRQGARAVRLVEALPASPGRVFELAMALEAAGETVASEQLLRALLKIDAKASHILNALGYGLVDRNASPALLAEGTAMLEQAYALSPDSAAIADSLGWAYFRAGNVAKAQPLLEAAYSAKRDPEVAAHLGELLFVTGKPRQARVIWDEALSIDAQHPVLRAALKRLGVAP